VFSVPMPSCDCLVVFVAAESDGAQCAPMGSVWSLTGRGLVTAELDKWLPVLASGEMLADPCPGDDDADTAGSALHDVRQHPAERWSADGASWPVSALAVGCRQSLAIVGQPSATTDALAGQENRLKNSRYFAVRHACR
jgi:hypothetical protein